MHSGTELVICIDCGHADRCVCSLSAIRLVQQARKWVKPNRGFYRQLQVGSFFAGLYLLECMCLMLLVAACGLLRSWLLHVVCCALGCCMWSAARILRCQRLLLYALMWSARRISAGVRRFRKGGYGRGAGFRHAAVLRRKGSACWTGGGGGGGVVKGGGPAARMAQGGGPLYSPAGPVPGLPDLRRPAGLPSSRRGPQRAAPAPAPAPAPAC
jgi:hypothetical protein